MGRAAKRKRVASVGKGELVKDFAKKKAKLGRKVRAENKTDVTVRTRQIYLPKQEPSEQHTQPSTDASTQGITSTTVDQHISKTIHHNPGARVTAFNALRNLAKSPSVLAKAALNVRLPALIAASGVGLADATRTVRRAAGDLLCAIISPKDTANNNPPSKRPYNCANTVLPSIAPHILASLSHVRHDVRVDAARLLALLINPPCYVNPLDLFPITQGASHNPLPALTHVLSASRDPSQRITVLDAITAVLSYSRSVVNDRNTTILRPEAGSKFYYHVRNQKNDSDTRRISSLIHMMKTDDVFNLTRRIAHVVSESTPASDGGEGHPIMLNSSSLALAAVAHEICSTENAKDYTKAKDLIRSVLRESSRVNSLIAEGFGHSRGKESDCVAVALADAALSIGANSDGVSLLRNVLKLAADHSGRKYVTARLMKAVQRAVASSEKALALATSNEANDLDVESGDQADTEESANKEHLNALQCLVDELSQMLLYYSSIKDQQVVSRMLPLMPTLIKACQTIPRLEKTRTKLVTRNGIRAIERCLRPRKCGKDDERKSRQDEAKDEVQQNDAELERDGFGEFDCVGEKAFLIGIEVFEIASQHTPPMPVPVQADPEPLERERTINEIVWLYAMNMMKLCTNEEIIRLLSATSLARLAGMMSRVGPSILLSTPVVLMIARGLRCRSGPELAARHVDSKGGGTLLFASRIFLDAVESVARHCALTQWWTRRLQATLTVLDGVVEKSIEEYAKNCCGIEEIQGARMELEEVRLQLMRMWDLILQEEVYE